jgi:hypothetical protein
VQTKRDRERSLEHLLRQSGGAVSTQGECIDAEAFGAWMGGTLRPREATAIEQHVSTCARCQTMIATFARTEPALQRRSWLQRWHVRWLVPIATAATVAAVWIAIPRDESTRLASRQEPSVEIARDTDAQEKPLLESAPPAMSTNPSTPLRDGADASQREELQARVPVQSKPEPQQSPPASDALAREADRVMEKSADQRARAMANQTASAEGRVGGASAAAPAPPAAFREMLTVTGVSPIVLEIVSPNPAYRWRISSGRQVEQSTDGGAQWEAAAIAADEELLAGHAPAASVCWLVGRGGVVYVTTDGTHFVRLPFIEPVDLRSVVAVDDMQATVTTRDGRGFRTTDRGATWVPTRGAQEILPPSF